MKNFFSGKRLLVILAVAAILGIIVAVRSCSDRVKPDLTISYIGEGYFSSDEFYKNVPTMLSDIIEDINGDGKKEIELVTISFDTNITASQEQANKSKMTMSMGQGDSRLYFMDKQYCEYYADNEVLMDLSGLITEDMDVLINNQGKVYGVSVENCDILKKIGLDDTTEIYASIRAITEMDHINFKNPGPEEMNKAAEDVLLYILNYKSEEM